MPAAQRLDDQEVLGARLRAVRQARGLSLRAVEIASGGAIDQNMLGAYERGEHAITAVRLVRLARLYNVSLEELFALADERWGSPVEQPPKKRSPRFDVARLGRVRRPEAKAVAHLAAAVQERRHRRVVDSIELRHDDLATVAMSFGLDVRSLIDVIRRTDALRHPQGRPAGS
jgi:transcriptional regulator with XRE-family HTH domain